MNRYILLVGIVLALLLPSAIVHAFSAKSYRFSTALHMSVVDYNLTPKLTSMAESLRIVPDDKLRYQQLLFLASKATPMDESLKVPENKVQGCLSTVYVHATLDSDGKVQFVGDSDSQLTKGLVTLLVNGLSGSTVDQVMLVKADFIKYAGIAQSLTPGRNSGFLNMLNLMKKKAQELQTANLRVVDKDGNLVSSNKNHVSSGDERPIYNSIKTKLSLLKPAMLEVIDESHQHAGHKGIEGQAGSGETHFKVKIVADCFNGLSLVQRHKMIYTLLSYEMSNGVHALSISAQTPNER